MYEKEKERYKNILVMRKSGSSFKEIGDYFNISATRICQIIKHTPKWKEKQKNPTWDGKPKWIKKGRDRARELARIRDNHQCRECGKKQIKGKKRLDVHHTQGLCGKKSRKYDSSKNLNLLITLCHKCHFNRHDHSQKLSTG